MHFKYEMTVRDLSLSGRQLEIHCGGPHNVKVLLREPTQQELGWGHPPTTAFCIATSQQEPSERIGPMFADLGNRRLPSGWNKLQGWESEIDEGGRIKDNINITIAFLPQAFQSFAKQVQTELSDASIRAVKIIRWRRNVSGPHHPFSFVGFQWSLDGSDWRHMPHAFIGFGEQRRGLSFSSGFADEVAALMNEGHDEPVAHELFREAWENRHTNRRSALLLAIAAAETGFKQCVTYLVPEANWLMENVPSPPLEKMLKDYLPILPAKRTIAGKVAALPENEVIKVIRNGVSIRNKITHTGANAPSYETIEEVLLAVRDVLWLLDYYCGKEWALEYVRPEIREKMGIPRST